MNIANAVIANLHRIAQPSFTSTEW